MSSMKVLARAMTNEETTFPPSALATRLDVTVFTCHRMGVSRSEGPSTGASDPNGRWASPSSAAVQRGIVRRIAAA